jgi:antitoxin YefM
LSGIALLFIAGRPGFPPWIADLTSALCSQASKGIDLANAFAYALDMTSIRATHARSKLYQLLDEAADSHEPIKITGKRANGVLISEDDWRSIQETLYLLAIPGMRESIRKGMKEPLEKCSDKPGW